MNSIKSRHFFEVRHIKLDKSGNVIPSDIFDPQNIAASCS